MAPSVDSPMTPSSDTPKSNRSQRIAPIVPAIPRSLERKPKPTAPKPASPLVEAKTDVESPAVAAATQVLGLPNGDVEEVDVKADTDVQEAGSVEDDDPEVPAQAIDCDAESEEEIESKYTFQSAVLIGQALTVLVVVDNKEFSPSNTEDFGIEKHGFKSHFQVSTKKSPPAAISTGFPTEVSADSLDGVGYDTEDTTGNGQGRQSATARTLPFRSAVNFHAHPTPPSEITDTTSPTASSSKGNNLAQSFLLNPQPTPPTDVTPSPTQSAYQQFPHQGCGHAHNISFHPPPPLSSNGTASPARSTHQGHAHQQNPHPEPYAAYGYSPHDAHGDFQPPHFLQHQATDSISSGQGYGPQTSYNHPAAFPVIGSQPPFTPSATPFNNNPQHWNYSNVYPTPAPWEYGHPPTHAPPPHPDFRCHSTSPSTLKSDKHVSGDVEIANATQSSGDASLETNPFPSTAYSASRQISINGPPDITTSLVEHLLENFNNEEYADCQLVLFHKGGRFLTTEWPLNSLLIAQIPALRAALKLSVPEGNRKKLLRMKVQGRFITPRSVDAALRACYGEPIAAFTGAGGPTTGSEDSWMDECLDYAATGAFLGLKERVLRGLKIASVILSWESLESALCYGLESVREGEDTASAAMVEVDDRDIYVRRWPDRNYIAYDGDRRPSSCVLSTPPSQKGLETVSGLSPPDSYSGQALQSAYDFLKHCLRFLKDKFPANWQLDVTARPLADADRLPITKNSRSPLSRSRLGHIQFGQMPSEAERSSSTPDVFISTIVLSIDFQWLNFILKMVGEPIRRHLVSIVSERERRRHAVLQSEDVVGRQRTNYDAYRWGEAGYEESVQTTGDGGLILSRRFAGIAGILSPDGKLS